MPTHRKVAMNGDHIVCVARKFGARIQATNLHGGVTLHLTLTCPRKRRDTLLHFSAASPLVPYKRKGLKKI